MTGSARSGPDQPDQDRIRTGSGPDQDRIKNARKQENGGRPDPDAGSADPDVVLIWPHPTFSKGLIWTNLLIP